ncbi:MAG: FAD-dependent oxidoreductase [Syntrophaceae bacterium]
MYDAIVIGAGYAGMSVAALLANRGRKVLVVEKLALIGGRAYSYSDDEGYTWEYGAHSHRLAELGLANQVFKALNDPIEFLPQAGGAKLIFKDRLWDRPEGPLGFLSTPMLSLPARVVLMRLLLKIKQAETHAWYDRTLLEFYHACSHNREVERFLSLFGMTVMCPDPAKASAGEVIDFLQRVLATGIGAGEPAGGSKQIFSKLQRHISDQDAIHLQEKITEICVKDGTVTGVITDKAEYQARHVIYTGRLPLLFGLIDRGLFAPEFVSYAEKIENSSGLTIDFILKQSEPAMTGGILGVDIPIWARFQSNTDPSFTPKGRFLSTWGILLPWGFDGDPTVAKSAENRLKNTIAKIFPNFLRHVVMERVTVVPVLNGTVLKPSQSKPHRPRVVCETIKGLYFAGDTVRGDGCSGDISFSSALKVAEIISAEDQAGLKG